MQDDIIIALFTTIKRVFCKNVSQCISVQHHLEGYCTSSSHFGVGKNFSNIIKVTSINIIKTWLFVLGTSVGILWSDKAPSDYFRKKLDFRCLTGF